MLFHRSVRALTPQQFETLRTFAISPACRTAMFWLGLAALLIVAFTTALRIPIIIHHHQLLSGLILTLIILVIIPARIWPAALVLGGVMLWLLKRAMDFKVRAVGLPITYLDVITNAREPHIIIRALGYRGPLGILAIAAAVILAGVVVLAIRRFGRPSRRRVIAALAEVASLSVVAGLALGAAGRDIRDRLPSIYPELALDLWEPESQRTLERRVGPLDYLAYTYVAGDGQSEMDSTEAAPPLPEGAIREAVARYIRLPAAGPTPLPNIVIFHAESTFDPNSVFLLTRRVDLPLWDRGSDTRSLGSLEVNVVGGGSWVTEFEVITGVDSRGFGYNGYYTHQTIGPRVRNALPSFLAAKGYQTAAFYTDTSGFFGAEPAFHRYGFRRFVDHVHLGLQNDWSNTDRDVINQVIAHGGFLPNDHPLLLFVSSLENHGPHPCVHFRDRTQLLTSLQGNADFTHDCSLNEYLLRARSTWSAVDNMIRELKRLQLVTHRPFVLLVYGDHQPWSFTEGVYNVAGGTVTDKAMPSFQRYRRDHNEKQTFYHVYSSVSGVLPQSFETAVPATLLPTLLSAYVATRPDDLYLPLNFLALARCGSDYRASNCPLRHDMQLWTRDYLFGVAHSSP
jgi:Sulfatase